MNTEKMMQSAREHGMDLDDNPVAYEFYNRATGHAIVDYTRWTHVGHLTEADGYEARPLVYATRPIQLQGAASPQGEIPDAEAAKPPASSGPDGPASAALAADLPALLLQAAVALEHAVAWLDEETVTGSECASIAAALRQRIGRE